MTFFVSEFVEIHQVYATLSRGEFKYSLIFENISPDDMNHQEWKEPFFDNDDKFGFDVYNRMA